MDITQRIKGLCEQRGWTQYRLAKVSGIPQSSLNAMLTRDGDPSIRNITKICEGLGISLTEFFSGLEEPSEEMQEIIDIWNGLDKSARQFAKTYMYGLSCRDIKI